MPYSSDILEKNRKLSITIIALAAGIVFFATALSTFNDWVKLGVIAIDLGVSGTLLGKLSGQEQHYGFIILRGVLGFKQMKYVARHYASLSKALADFGLTLGFGVLYGWRSFGISKKLFVHAIGLVLFYSVFLAQPTLVEGTLLTAVGFFAGLFGIAFYFLASHAFAILTVPATPPGVIPIVPGVTVPWEVVFALIIVAVVHELAHGVLSVIEKLEVKSSGVLLFGILPIGAFVEPDEEKMAKLPLRKQLRILVAGSTSNALFFIVFLALALGMSFLQPAFVQSVSVSAVDSNSTAFSQLHVGDKILQANGIDVKTANQVAVLSQNGVLNLKTSDGVKSVRTLELEIASSANPSLSKGEQIYSAAGKDVFTAEDLRNALAGKSAGTPVILGLKKGLKTVALNSEGKLGITLAAKPTIAFQDDPYNPFLFGLFSFLLLIVVFTYVLNFILASVNLLPIFLTDGQRIFTVELQEQFGRETGAKIALAVGLVTVGLLLVNALPWFT